MDKAPVLTDEQISIDQRDSDHDYYTADHELLLEKIKMLTERIQFLESEVKAGAELVAKLSDRNMVLEASLADVKNQVERVRKETARDILGSLALSDDNKDMRH
jgi:hypothetical protein